MHENESEVSPLLYSSQVFIAFLDLLKIVATKNLKLVPIRHRALDEITAFSGGDYDFILPSDEHNAFLSILFDLMSSRGISFSIDQTKQDKKVVHLHISDEQINIALEIWSHLEVKDPSNKTCRYIYWTDLAPHLKEHNGHYSLPLGIEGCYYLSHLYTKKKELTQPEVIRRLSYYQQQAQLQANQTLHDLIEQLQNTQSITAVAEKANLALVEAGVLKLFISFAERFKSKIADLPRQYHKKKMRACSAKKIVAFVGPDGVGKTTLIEQCHQILQVPSAYFRFKKLFRGSLLYKLLYVLRFRALAKLHGDNLPKNEFDELMSSHIFWIALINYPRLWLQAQLSAWQLSDRYYSDLLFENLRRNDQPTRLTDLWKSKVKFIPKPSWLIQLDAATDIILSRKQELSAEAIGIYRQGVFSLYLANPAPYYSYINTGHTLSYSHNTIKLIATGLELASYEANHYDLHSALPLGEGNERICYLHPDDKYKIIKVTKQASNGRNQNQIEKIYLQELQQRKVPLQFIPSVYSWMNTSKGKGLVFDRIMNDDESPLLSLAECLQRKLICWSDANQLLSELYEYLHRYSIIFADVGLNNLVCYKQNNTWQLAIIDGLGARRLGLKFYIYRKFHLLARIKLKRQWKIFLKKLETVVPRNS